MTILLTKKDKAKLEQTEQFVFVRFGVNRTELYSEFRKQKLVHARFIAYYILNKKHKWVLQKIADVFKKDQSTVGDGIRQCIKLKLNKEIKDV